MFWYGPNAGRRDLHDRDAELNELWSGVDRGDRLIVVYGIRRIGETFLSDNNRIDFLPF